jgi:hypothetical protein
MPLPAAGFGTNLDMSTCARCPVGWYSRGGPVGVAYCKPCPQLSTSNPARTACSELLAVNASALLATRLIACVSSSSQRAGTWKLTSTLCALCCAVLCCAVLCCAVLCCAVLCCAVLCCAVPFRAPRLQCKRAV